MGGTSTILASMVFHCAPNIAEPGLVIRSTSRFGGSNGAGIGAGGAGGAGVCATEAAEASSGKAIAAMILANCCKPERVLMPRSSPESGEDYSDWREKTRLPRRLGSHHSLHWARV